MGRHDLDDLREMSDASLRVWGADPEEKARAAKELAARKKFRKRLAKALGPNWLPDRMEY